MTYSLFFLAQANNSLKFLRLSSGHEAVSNTLITEVLLGVAVVALAVGAFFYVRNRLRARNLVDDLEQARLKVLTEDLNLTPTELELLQTISGETSIAELLDVMESRRTFEAVVQRFREANPEHPSLRRISQLRQRLGFGFSNARNPFVDTRMLTPGMRMRCRIKLPKREVSFLTVVMAVNETQFVIRPPTVKGKPQPLGRLPALGFHVSREHDAEYEFTAPVQGQLATGAQPVLCGHTRKIQRLLFRNADRIQVDLPAVCFLIRQEIAGDRAATKLRAQDAQARFPAQIKDISIGGAQLMAEAQEAKVAEGDLIIFALSAAQLQFDLVAQAVGVVTRENQPVELHLQFMGLRELDRLKLGKYLIAQKEKGAAFTSGNKSDQPPAQGAP